MYSILIGLVLVTIIAVILAIQGKKGREKIVILGMFLFSIILMISIFVPMCLGFCPEREEIKSIRSIDIVSIKDNSSITGEVANGLLVWRGYVKEEPCYFFYRKASGGYILDSIKARDAIVYEDSGKGYIEEITTTSIIDKDWKKKYIHWLIFMDSNQDKVSYKIHIPEGSILRNFTLDSE